MRCPFCDGDGGEHAGPHVFASPGVIGATYTHPLLSFAVIVNPLGVWIATHRPTMDTPAHVAALAELLVLAGAQLMHLRGAPAESADVLRNATWGSALRGGR